MSQKQNRRSVITYKKTYKVPLKLETLHNIIEEIFVIISSILLTDFRVQPILLQKNANNKTKNKAKRF